MRLKVFFATWCQPCKRLKPVLDQLPQQFIQYIDIDTSQGLIERTKYKVPVVPSMIVIDQAGNQKSRHQGFMTYQSINNWLDAQ